MRVTHVITRLIVGGAQENTIASVIGLRQVNGMEVDLISGPTTGPEGSLESVLPPTALTIVPSLVRPVNPWKDVNAFWRLTKLFRQRRPDIVHTHSGKAGILGRLAAGRAGVPIIVHTIHGPSFGAFQDPISNIVFRMAERQAARVTNHFVVVAQAMANQYLEVGIGHPEQYTRIFSGFALEPFVAAKNDPDLRARYGLNPDDIVVGKIARLFKLKGHDDLFAVAPRIVRENQRIKFLLVGNGEWRARFEAKARQCNLEKHFVFAGLVPPAEVPALVGIMDMVVHLSSREGLARAIPQALAAGKPVVAYDSDGANEVCIDDQTGFLVRPGHLNGLAERILLLAREPELRARLGLRGQELVRKNFAVGQMVDALHNLYRKLAEKPGIQA